jgi:rhamnosyl/mannosyltransferase
MGGIEQVINQIARGCVKLGIKVDVLSLTADKAPITIEINGYRAHRARLDFQIASTGFSISAFWRFFQLAKQADIITTFRGRLWMWCILQPVFVSPR